MPAELALHRLGGRAGLGRQRARAVKSGSNWVWKVPDRQAGVAVAAGQRATGLGRGRLGGALLGQLGEVALRRPARPARPAASASVSTRMWLTHSAPVPAGSSAYRASSSSADGAGSWRQRLDRGRAPRPPRPSWPAASSCRGRVARDLGLDGVDGLLRRLQAVRGQEVLGGLPGDDLRQPAAGGVARRWTPRSRRSG